MIGSELIWGRRENFLDGFKSDDFHIQFSFKYNFSKELSSEARSQFVFSAFGWFEGGIAKDVLDFVLA